MVQENCFWIARNDAVSSAKRWIRTAEDASMEEPDADAWRSDQMNAPIFEMMMVARGRAEDLWAVALNR